MARAEDHLTELLRMQMPVQERAGLLGPCLTAWTTDGEDRDAEQAQVIELIRRMKALDAGQANVIDAAEARARVLARLRSVRGQ